VNITIRVLSKPDSSQLRWIFRTLGKGKPFIAPADDSCFVLLKKRAASIAAIMASAALAAVIELI